MLWWMVFPYLVAGIGVIFYVSHFPEVSCCSGKFDIYGASHQIWHVLIFSGETKRNVYDFHLICSTDRYGLLVLAELLGVHHQAPHLHHV